MTISQLKSDRYHRRHTREGGYPVFNQIDFRFYAQHSITPILQHAYTIHVSITQIATDIPITNRLDSHPFNIR